MSILKIYQPQVRAYRDTVEDESWKSDHDGAMRCRDLEQLLVLGVGIYEALDKADETLRLASARGKFVYDEATGNVFDRLFDWWLSPCDQVEREIKKLEAEGFVVEGADQFRRCAKQATEAKADREVEA